MKKQISWFLAAFFVFLLAAPRAHAFDTEVLLNSGDPANRIDIAILGDGYRTEDQTQLTNDANNALSALFAEGVYGEYRDYFNVRLVHVISNETGADNGAGGGLRDTALGAFFNCQGIDRLLCVDQGAVFTVAAADAPEFDVILVIVNDLKYGGAGGSQILTSSISVSPSAFEVPVHEMGHTLFGLADEYSDPFPGFPLCDPVNDCFEPNVTLFTDRPTFKWGQWVDAATPLPTPDTSAFDGVVGAFEGARYMFTGVFRPIRSCLMRALGESFCPVCSEAGVVEFYSRVDHIDEALPTGPVTLAAGDSADFTIIGPRPDPNTLSFSWTIDGSPIAVNDTGILTLTGADFGAGTHVLTVTIHDDTLRVRRDDGDLLTGTFSWTVTGEDPNVPCVLGRVSASLRDRTVFTSALHAGTFLIGNDARLDGSAFATGNGSLGARSTILGDATLGGTLSGNRAGVAGTLTENASVVLPVLVTRNVVAGSGSQSFGTTTLVPAARGNVTFRAGATITLVAGLHRFQSLIVEPGARIRTTGGAVQVDVRGNISIGDRAQAIATSPGDLGFYSNGTALRIGTDVPFTGIVVAPNAAIDVFSRTRINGCIGGRTLNVEPDVTLDSAGAELPTQ